MLLGSIWLWVTSLFFPSYESLPPINGTARFHVIGAGLSRTGTFSTRIALSKLLGGKCYHGFTGSMSNTKSDFWLRAADGQLADADWHALLEGQGYTSGAGEPVSLFFDDLMKVYPDAKVLLTTRPADKWYRSMQKAIIEPRSWLERPPVSWVFDYFGFVHSKAVMETVRAKVAANRGFEHTSWTAVEAGQEAAVKHFEEWNSLVIRTVPADRLLVYDVREGWEPLCRFLGLPVPDEPFPQINDYKTIQWIYKGSYILVLIVLPIVLVLLLLYRWRRSREVMLSVGVVVVAVVFFPVLWLRRQCSRASSRASSGATSPTSASAGPMATKLWHSNEKQR